MGPPVAKPATNPWAPGLENSKRSSKTGAEPTAARVLSTLVSSKSLILASAAKAPNEKKYVRSFLD